MNKLTLVAAISGIIASPSFAAYTGTATSGTAADPLASIKVNTATASAITNVWYVDLASGPATNKTAPAIQMVKASGWTFDFTNLAAVTFTGNIQYGDYRTQTTAQALAILLDGRQSYTGVTQSFSGTGAYDEATNTFTFTKLPGAVNGGGASVYSETAAATCVNGVTSSLGKVCTSFSTASKNWEGLALSFVFSEDRSAFSGTLAGTDTSGGGLSLNTTTINWQIAAAQPAVPVPAAAWLFGSGLIGLTGMARRRRAAT
ncbi:MAG TPA: VPLPA-CTERM sorting domain-containing protein [Spongiibacteraceae bacterium]|nr:VPLPA-CTERM sorting domain-containing protein [Spongiibacteraceae bacterium]